MKKARWIAVMMLTLTMVLMMSIASVAVNSTIQIDFTTVLTTVEEGKPVSLRGKITSHYKITSVIGIIEGENNKEIFRTTDIPNAKSMDIRPANLNQKLLFDQLKPGNYVLRIVVKDEQGGYERLDKAFVVKGENPVPQPNSDLVAFEKSESKENAWYIVDEESTSKGTPLRSSPAGGDNIVGYVKKNDVVYVVSKGKNNAGNLWYKLEGEMFVYGDRLRQGRLLTVTYIAPGADNIPGKGSLPEGVNAKISSQIPTKAGYQFLGWTTNTAAEKVEYRAGDKILAFGNVGLYAVWEKLPDLTDLETFRCTQTAVNKWYIVDEQSTAQGTPLRTAPKSGTATQSGTFVKKGDSLFVVAKGVNCAGNIWYQLEDGMFIYSDRVRQAKNFTVTYHANGGSNAPAMQTVTEGVAVKLSAAGSQRSEYTFLGWAESSTASKAAYMKGEQIIPMKNLTIYAVWRKSDYNTYRSIVNQLNDSIGSANVLEAQSNKIVKDSGGGYTKNTGICNVCATATLLNRNLYFEDNTNQPLFTIPDILEANGCTLKHGPTTEYIGNKYNRRGYEYTGGTVNCYKKAYTDSMGNTYQLVGERLADIDKNKGKLSYDEYLTRKLREHPEGIMLRSIQANHTVVITDYEVVNGKIQYYVMDPANSGRRKLENTYLNGQLKDGNLFYRLDYISYIKK